MPAERQVVVVLVLLIALGIVGRMDYEDAKRMERVGSKEGMRLFCVRFPIDVAGELGLAKSKRPNALLVSVAPTAEVVSAPVVFRCVVVEE